VAARLLPKLKPTFRLRRSIVPGGHQPRYRGRRRQSLGARQAVRIHGAEGAGTFEHGEKINPLILVGDLADPNAVERRAGFMDVIEKYPDLFNTPVEIATNWDTETALAGLEAAVTAKPILISSSPPPTSYSRPSARCWNRMGCGYPPGNGTRDLGGLDGDATACQLIKEGWVDSTGVQDLYYEAELVVTGILDAIANGDTQPNAVLQGPGFALTAGNLDVQEMDMWGCVLLADGFLEQ
jgi:inositol transport system substrate-binding protein